LYHKTFPVDGLAAAVNNSALGTLAVAPPPQKQPQGAAGSDAAGRVSAPSTEAPSRAEVDAIRLTQGDVRAALGARAEGEFADLHRWPDEGRADGK
jgi:hypothetical protein